MTLACCGRNSQLRVPGKRAQYRILRPGIARVHGLMPLAEGGREGRIGYDSVPRIFDIGEGRIGEQKQQERAAFGSEVDGAENADRSQAGPLGRGHEMVGKKIVRPLRLCTVSKLELPQLVVLRPDCGTRRGQQRRSRQSGDRFASIHVLNNIPSSGGDVQFFLGSGGSPRQV